MPKFGFLKRASLVLVTLLSLLFLSSKTDVQAATCSVGSATGNDTSQIQAAIDSCAGGGEVRLTSGQTYTAGTIWLKSGVTLNLNNATLRGSGDPGAFAGPSPGRVAFVAGMGVSNVKIIGPGTITMTGETAVLDSGVHSVYFQDTNGIEVRDIRIDTTQWAASASVGMHLRTNNVQNILIEDVVVRGDRNSWGNDGIALYSTRDAIVRRCDVETFDDGIWARGNSTNVLFEDCVVRASIGGAILVGTGEGESLSNIAFRNITVHESGAGAIHFKFRDSGVSENITYENITIDSGVSRWVDSVWHYVVQPCPPEGCEFEDLHDSAVRNLCFKDIAVMGGAGGSARIIGDGDTRVENLTFSNVQFNGSPPYVSFVDVNGLTLSRSGQKSDYDYENVTGIYVTDASVDCGGSPPPPPQPTITSGPTGALSPTPGSGSCYDLGFSACDPSVGYGGDPWSDNCFGAEAVDWCSGAACAGCSEPCISWEIASYGCGVELIEGDLDGDGDVDIFDYNLLISSFGSATCGDPADIDGNCKVDIFDYNILVENFGRKA